ncbi:MAG: Gfo/Idh/MocA family oxidoreductase [Sedimentisphaerales bacterium]|nr:Gfo/Idh/MocA family oxidoreductase [Sedimentisphaerales bacterium]
MPRKQPISRRQFLKKTAAAGAALSFPVYIPQAARGANGSVAASNRIVMGAIGVGSMGTGDLQGFLGKPEVQFVAVCDVDRNHRENARKIVNERYNNQDCRAYLDFRELIGRGDLDAVMTAVPDHWHAIPAIAAARAGLDIHGQKPFARSIREGRAICDAVHRFGRVWQTGSQQRSERDFHLAAELVRNGRIGKVLKIEVGLPTGGRRDPQPEIPVPDTLDWEFWLGPAPWRPYCNFGQGGCHWDWRWIMDYSGGQLTDWAGHHIDIAHWGMGWDTTGPVAIEGRGEYPESGLYNVPFAYKFDCTYQNGVVMTVANNQQVPQGTKWYGEKGWIYVRRGLLQAEPAGVLQEQIGPGEIHLHRSRDHKQDFLDAVKTRQLPIAPAEVGHRSISVGLLGEIAMLTGRRIRWNPDTEQILNDPGAAALLGRAYREPWTL